MPAYQDILTMPREELRKFKTSSDFNITPDSMGEDARISLYALPVSGHQYVIGSDFAYGIAGRDYDAGVVLDKSTWPIEQVAELEGRWGNDRYDRLLYCMARIYNNAFIVGERQVGLSVLRSLVNNFEYGYLYYNRDEASRGRRRQDSLGHAKVAGDPLIPRLRAAIREDHLILRSERNAGQVRAYQFRPKGKQKEKTEDMRDSDLTMGAPSGEFDDLVNADAYAWKGIEEIHLFDDEKPIFEEGTAGAALGMAKALELEPKRASRQAFKDYDRGIAKRRW